MVIKLSISPEAESRLKAKAAFVGLDLETFAARCLERLSSPPSLKDLSGPIAHAVAQADVTEDQLAEFLEEEKHAMRTQRRTKPPT